MKIELIRRVPTTKTEYFEIIGISRWFFVLPRRSFPAIFPQLSDERIIKSSTSGTRSHILQVYNPLLYHCATLSFYETVWQSALSFSSSVLVYFRQYCVSLRQYCVNLRQYCVFLCEYSAGIFKQSMGARNRAEIVFVNVYEAQDSIQRNRFRQARNRFLGSLKGLQIWAQAT
jgi:hypothetical protein